MKGAFQIAKLFNIPVRVHWTFFLLVLWVIYTVRTQEGSYDWVSISLYTGFLIILFVCVILHEFGHALTARKYGVNTLDIIISPIGGVARLDRIPSKPIQEFWVAIAGPLVNFGIILILGAYLLLFGDLSFEDLKLNFELYLGIRQNVEPLNTQNQVIFILLLINFILAVFNLLPAFPLDGGRIFRALLSIRFGRLPATRIAVYVGQIFAVLLFLYGLWNSQYITAFIGFFVFTTARNEYDSVKWEIGLNNYFVKQIMNSQPRVLSSEHSKEEALSIIQDNIKSHYPILDANTGQVLGILNGERLKKADLNIPIIQLMQPLQAILRQDDSLKIAYYKMHQTKSFMLPVIEEDGLIGTLTKKDIETFIKTIKK